MEFSKQSLNKSPTDKFNFIRNKPFSSLDEVEGRILASTFDSK